MKAPGKINRLIKKLERLDHVANALSNAELQQQLDSVAHDIELLERDMTTEEMDRLKTTLQFKNLPPLRDLPEKQQLHRAPKTAIRPEEAQPEMFNSTALLASSGGYFPPPQPQQLRYHSRLFVPPV